VTSKSTGSASSQRSISSLYEERKHGQLNKFGRAQKLGEAGIGGVYKGFIRPPVEASETAAMAELAGCGGGTLAYPLLRPVSRRLVAHICGTKWTMRLNAERPAYPAYFLTKTWASAYTN
jgi:hypothetical protein